MWLYLNNLYLLVPGEYSVKIMLRVKFPQKHLYQVFFTLLDINNSEYNYQKINEQRNHHKRYVNMAIEPISNFPKITWEQFAVCNDDKTTAFEDLSRQLFYYEFIKQTNVPHSNHNNPGVEVDPELEPIHEDGSKRRLVSFQAKFFENKIQWGKFRESSEKAIQNYEGKLDHIYLFCNKTITKSSSLE